MIVEVHINSEYKYQNQSKFGEINDLKVNLIVKKEQWKPFAYPKIGKHSESPHLWLRRKIL